MRILQICPKSPFPPAEGGPIAMKAIRDGLMEAGHFVHTFTLSTPKFPVSEKVSKSIPHFSHAYLDTSLRVFPALRDLLLNRSYHISRFYHRRIESIIVSLIQQSKWDVVLVESQFMMPYIHSIRKHFSGVVLLRTLNVEYMIWNRVAANERNALKRLYLRVLTRQLKRYEIKCFAQADAVATISEVDADLTRVLQPAAFVKAIPFAIRSDLSAQLTPPIYSAKFGHIGSMDWAPNAEGMSWFLHFVWPEIRKSIPYASMHLAGRNMPESLQTDTEKGIIVYGEVPSAAEFMKSLDAMIVPLLSGSGIRIKIAEAMSLGVPVITTKVGAEGLMVEPGIDIFICDSAEEIVHTLTEIDAEPKVLQAMGAQAMKAIHVKHNPEDITRDLCALLTLKKRT